jgi:hypothetical protein
MSSAFLVFDLIVRNALRKREATHEVSSIQNLMTVKTLKDWLRRRLDWFVKDDDISVKE